MRKTKTVYSFNSEGIFISTDVAWESWDLNGIFLLPANSTEIAPPSISEKQFAFWNGSEWEIKNIIETESIKELENPKIVWEQIREQRNNLLFASDWAMLSDSNPKPSKEAWLTYRQTLRDIPSIFKTPEEVVWPEKP